ncbi:MAG: hypothetical protein U0S50_06055 [Sphingopyxis sp.]|uniref:hypothetical protein n=1 Tax=Sphingopyxis sp. TaxID=1908224 RepID=UPI002AB99E0F|nr:hypothetical protein [Sphingopyxis sp.]MDZ3831364.1 hypothetical protein [Sphingopyxis sp.]
MIRILVSALALSVALPSVALAEAVEEKNLLSGKDRIDPTKGYIYISGPVRQMGMLLRLPDAATIAEYEQEWRAALTKVQEKYPGKLESWERRAELAEQRQSRVPEKPMEPTEENFAIGAIELRDPVSFGPQYVFAKGQDPDRYSYLVEVKPGRYAYYGPLFFLPNVGMQGACYCMGTVSFEVKAGSITDTGNFFLAGPGVDPAFPPPPAKLEGSEAGLYRPVAGSEQWGAVTYGLPESLRSFPNEQADFRAYGKLDNFYRAIVGRMPPVPGVLAYDRDKIIDLKAAPIAVDGAD